MSNMKEEEQFNFEEDQTPQNKELTQIADGVAKVVQQQ